jgi:hypothetical protein
MKNILLYFDTSALVSGLVSKSSSSNNLLSKISSIDISNVRIISSIWTMNEIIGFMDKLSQKTNKKTGFFELSNIDIQKVISTIVSRIKTISKSTRVFNFVYLDHNIITDSRKLTRDFHLTPNDAIHMCTGYTFNCNYFIVHNKSFVNQFPFKKYASMKLVDLTNENDRKLLENELDL